MFAYLDHWNCRAVFATECRQWSSHNVSKWLKIVESPWKSLKVVEEFESPWILQDLLVKFHKSSWKCLRKSLWRVTWNRLWFFSQLTFHFAPRGNEFRQKLLDQPDTWRGALAILYSQYNVNNMRDKVRRTPEAVCALCTRRRKAKDAAKNCGTARIRCLWEELSRTNWSICSS